MLALHKHEQFLRLGPLFHQQGLWTQGPGKGWSELRLEKGLVNVLIPPSGVQRGNFTPIGSEPSFRLHLR